ncbi:hypothetical protein EDB19DRAFT_1752760 [Suillus lakei]|nr:hypothetical protein EDB19DRAFT_1752760 [Suillus lakei]
MLLPCLTADEGSGYDEVYGRVIAVPGIDEKGSLSTVTSPGGHSRFSPPHTHFTHRF